MKKLLLIVLLVAFVTPMFVSVLPGLGTAYAQDDDCQGDEDGETCL